MKSFTVLLLAFTALYKIQAQTQEKIPDIYECVFQYNEQYLCQENDQVCISEASKVIQSIETCKTENTTFNKFKSCILQNYQYQVCQQNDSDCQTEAISLQGCVQQCEDKQTIGDLKSCIQQKCQPNNPVNQNNLKVVLSCLSSTFLQFSLVLTFIL
ncbi:hypothetical protein ABPG73_004561, partial [Tetrahymena malaccensis]